MRKKYTYKDRRKQLIKNGASEIAIQNTLKEEFGIHKTLDEVKQDIKKVTGKNPVRDKQEIPALVSSIVSDSKTGISLNSIRERLGAKHAEFITPASIQRCLESDLIDKIEYDPISNKYRLVVAAFGQEATQKTRVPHILNATSKKHHTIDLSPVLNEIIHNAATQAIDVDTGIEALNTAIRNVVRDNLITETEKIYLLSKAKEYDYSGEILTEIQQATNNNNPYLDSTIKSIYDDGIITQEELQNLKENAKQIGLEPRYLNKRLWTISLAHYSSHLSQLRSFKKLIGACALAKERLPSCNKQVPSNLIPTCCDINSGYSIEEVLTKGTVRILQMIASELDRDISGVKSLIEKNTYHLDNLKAPSPNESGNDPDLIKILLEEGQRLGEPQANLLIENVLHRLNRKS